MSTISPQRRGTTGPASDAREARRRLKLADKRGNRLLLGFAIAAVVITLIAMVALLYQILHSAWPAISHFGFGFITNSTWEPANSQLGSLSLLYGTLMTSLLSMIAATLLGVSIGLLLAYMAPKRVAAVLGPLVEMLAAVPSVVIGLLGIFVLAPFVVKYIEPPLHAIFGWIPLLGSFFGPPGLAGGSIFTASLVLTFMVLPIIAALTRDLFLTVPQELRDGAEALGATRWEVIRGVVLPTTAGGIASACVLGFGRALGEAIAVSQVVGGETSIHFNQFLQGDTYAANLVNQFTSPANALHLSGLYYSAVILLVFGIGSNLISQRIARRSRIATGH